MNFEKDFVMDENELKELSMKMLNDRATQLIELLKAAGNKKDALELSDQIVLTMQAWAKRICKY